MARGEFVYFVDNDDWLEPDALERLHATAVRDGADIVIGKVVGHGKRVPRELFRENLHAVPFDSAKLLGLLTPHKLFRRALLDEHGIRFPEGRRRLEDHLFVVHAYFHARRHLGARRPPLLPLGRCATQPPRVVPAARARTATSATSATCSTSSASTPSPARCATACSRTGTAARCSGASAARLRPRDDDVQPPARATTIRALALERYDERVHARLAFNLRVRSALLRAGRYDALRHAGGVRVGAARSRARCGCASEDDGSRCG